MPRTREPSLRQQLLEGRVKIAEQIDKLRARPYPPVAGPMDAASARLQSLVINTNGVAIDNSELISRLTDLLKDIDDSLAELGPEKPRDLY